MKCRRYRPEPALSQFFSCRGHSPASAWRYRIFTHRRTNWLNRARALLRLFERPARGDLPQVVLGIFEGLRRRIRHAVSRIRLSGTTSLLHPRSRRAQAGGARPSGAHRSVPSRSLPVLRLDPSELPTLCDPAHDESSSAPGSPAPRMSEYASLELGKRPSNPKHRPALA